MVRTRNGNGPSAVATGGCPPRVGGAAPESAGQERAREAEHTLAQASDQLAASRDPDMLLDAIARLVLPALGDWCLIAPVDAEGNPERPVIRLAGPAMAPAMEEPPHREADRRVADESAPDLAAELTADPGQRDRFRRLGVGAYISAPLRAGERTLGALAVVSVAPARRYDQRDQALVEELARRAALVLDNLTLRRALAARESELQDLVGRMLQEQEEERRRIAYDLHDGLAQLAASAHQHLQAYDYRHRPRPPLEQEEIDQILAVTQQAVQEARRVIASLRPIALDDFGLGVALRRQVEYLRAHGWQIAYRDGLKGERFPPTVETALFRVAQEALNNVRKHARTTRATIDLARAGESLTLRVRDEGIGFAPEAAREDGAPGERIGLRGMHERVNLLGGTLHVTSIPGSGTQVTATVPVPAARP